jgi:hypothetical protein
MLQETKLDKTTTSRLVESSIVINPILPQLISSTERMPDTSPSPPPLNQTAALKLVEPLSSTSAAAAEMRRLLVPGKTKSHAEELQAVLAYTRAKAESMAVVASLPPDPGAWKASDPATRRQRRRQRQQAGQRRTPMAHRRRAAGVVAWEALQPIGRHGATVVGSSSDAAT